MSDFETAYRRLYPGVVRSAWAIVRDRARAEELAQEAFVRAYRRWRKLEDGGYVEPWLHRAAMNLALTEVKRRSRGRQLERHVGAQMPFAPSPLPSDDDQVVRLLRQLPRRQREAVFLRVVVDLAEEDVARLMGCSAGSVKVHKKRGLDRLKTLVGERQTNAVAREAAEAAQG